MPGDEVADIPPMDTDCEGESAPLVAVTAAPSSACVDASDPSVDVALATESAMATD
jgi:hypothetical protein